MLALRPWILRLQVLEIATLGSALLDLEATIPGGYSILGSALLALEATIPRDNCRFCIAGS